jgi:mannose-6-phosphate isomerase-like protein (cupin superfamily)
MPAGGSHAPGRAPARSHRRWLYAGATADPDVAFGALDRDSGERFQALRRQLGVRSFGMNLIVVQPRQRGRIHAHEHQEEVYFVLERELTLLVEGAEHVVGPDRLVRVGPAVRRQLVNAGTGAPRPARPRRIRGPREPRRPRLDFVGGRRARCTTSGDPAARRPTDRLSRGTEHAPPLTQTIDG